MRHSVRARLLLTFVCSAWALALPVPASAAGGSGASPVHIDPGSPVAKEYALPLATARGAPPESGKPGKLFGSGITHAGARPATPTTTAAAPAPPPQTQQQITVTTTPAATVPAPAAKRPARPHRVHVTTVTLPTLTATTLTATTSVGRRTARATPAAYRVLRPGSGSGLLWMLLAAAVVLAVGSAGGLLISRRR